MSRTALAGPREQILADLNRTWRDDRDRLFRSAEDALSVSNFNAVVDLLFPGTTLIFTSMRADDDARFASLGSSW